MLTRFCFLLFVWVELYLIRFIMYVNQFGRCPLYVYVYVLWLWKNESAGLELQLCVLTEWQNEWNETHKWTLRNVYAERLAGRFGLGWSHSDPVRSHLSLAGKGPSSSSSSTITVHLSFKVYLMSRRVTWAGCVVRNWNTTEWRKLHIEPMFVLHKNKKQMTTMIVNVTVRVRPWGNIPHSNTDTSRAMNAG